MATVQFGSTPFVIAHRGASAYAPENTLAAFALLPQFDAKWVEFDVMLSKDGVPMVFHDESLERITGVKSKLYHMSLAELATLDAGSWFDLAFRGELIPTLDTTLELLSPFVSGINLEIKSATLARAATVQAILRLIQEKYANCPIWYSSFDERCLQVVRSISTDCTLGWLSHHWQPHWQETVERLACQSIHFNHKVLSMRRVKACTAQGYPVFAYTVNDRDRALELFDWGVLAVYSDYPDLLTRDVKQT